MGVDINDERDVQERLTSEKNEDVRNVFRMFADIIRGFDLEIALWRSPHQLKISYPNQLIKKHS